MTRADHLTCHSSHKLSISLNLYLYPHPQLHLYHPTSCVALCALQGKVIFLNLKFWYISAFSYFSWSLGWSPRALHLYSSLSFATSCFFCLEHCSISHSYSWSEKCSVGSDSLWPYGLSVSLPMSHLGSPEWVYYHLYLAPVNMGASTVQSSRIWFCRVDALSLNHGFLMLCDRELQNAFSYWLIYRRSALPSIKN